MNTNVNYKRGLTLLLSVLFSYFLIMGCGSTKKDTPRTAVGQMDTPQYHVSRGDDAIAKGQYDDARSSFNKALNLDPDYSPALSGAAVSNAWLIGRPGVSNNAKQKVLNESMAKIEKALDTADSSDRKTLARAHNYAVQIYWVLQLPQTEWFENAQEHFEKAVDLTPNDPAPYFFMGQAEAKNLNFENATRLYKKVIGFSARYEAEANTELKRVQKIQRALPGSRFGRTIANVQEITRADISALFMAELRLDR